MQAFTQFEQTLAARFGGLLRAGSHPPDGKACLLEAAHVAIGQAWSDAPNLWPDLRPLNDASWSSDQVRTWHLTRVLRSYWEWSEWPFARRHQVRAQLVILSVQRLIAELPGFPEEIRAMCRAASTLEDCQRAAAAAARAAKAEAWAAEAAAWAAVAAAAEARAAEAEKAADRVLIQACDLWIEAARLP